MVVDRAHNDPAAGHPLLSHEADLDVDELDDEPRGTVRGCAFDPRAFPYPLPPAGAEPLTMLALVRLAEPGTLRLVHPGQTFTAPADRAGSFVVCGMGAVVERPAWWPPAAPHVPPVVLGPVERPGQAVA